MKVGIISDTHLTRRDLERKTGIFRRLERVAQELFSNVDCIIHCGDVVEHEVIDYLSIIAPTHVVRGNCDYDPSRSDWNSLLKLDLEGCKIIVAHDRTDLIPYVNEGYDLYVYGHTHIAKMEKNTKGWWINPGAIKRPAGEKRVPSVAILTLENGEISPEIRYVE